MAKGIGDVLSGILLSTGKSLITSELKKQAKGFIGARFAKTPEQARKEAANLVGYETEHFTLDKKDNLVFKSSSMFVLEWVNNSPTVRGRLMKDEENGQVYFDGKPLTNSAKVDLMSKFSKQTNIKNASLPGHLENALDLLDTSDFTSLKFGQEFAGWDPTKTSVIDTWVQNCFGSALTTPGEYAAPLFRKWIVGTARRALQPGSSHDGCLVLKGPAGVGKTRFFREMLPPPFDHRTGEIMCDIRSPSKFQEAIVGKTVACFDELSVLDYPKTHEIFKQLLSSQFIDVRLAWARKPQRYALRQGFSATTNRDNFIADKFLSRRLWIIELNKSKRLDFDFVHANNKDLWKEAVYLAKQGESCILTPEEQATLEAANKKFEK